MSRRFGPDARSPRPADHLAAPLQNTGANPILGWMVDFALPAGQKVDSVWNGSATYSGQEVMVHNTDWNGSLAAGASTTFGYVASGGPPDTATAPPCTVH